MKKPEKKKILAYSPNDPDRAYNQAYDEWEKFLSSELNKVADICMYDFPAHYSNSQIIAFQKGIDKMWSTILKRIKG